MGAFWPLVILTLVITLTAASNATGNTTECEAECKRCSEESSGSRGRCLALCHPSQRHHRIPCQPQKRPNEIIIGAVVGLVLCIILAVSGLLCVRFRKKRKDSLPKQSAKALKNFHKDLDRYRPHAYTFLAILNNVRRQVREMHNAGNTDAAVICGRSLSDLAKLLMLLNRRDVPVIPPDWPRLASWADRLLERTTLASPPPQAQVAQLIHFLQTPQKSHQSKSTTTAQSTPMSTMKPPAYEESIGLQDSLAFNDFSFKPDWSQQWEFPEESLSARGSVQHADAWQSRHEVTQDNLWLDDDFLLQSFRPQDEIVTVL